MQRLRHRLTAAVGMLLPTGCSISEDRAAAVQLLQSTR